MTEHTRPLKRGFAMKTHIAMAVEKAILMNMIDSEPVYDPMGELFHENLKAGGYVTLVNRLRYEQSMRRVEFAMTAAPVDDSAAMIRRMQWLHPDNFNPQQPSPAIA